MSVISHSAPTYDHSTSLSTTTLTPYLQLSHLLSLTWLAYPILSLLFVAFRLQLSLAASQDAVANAKDNLLASCKAAEQAATSAASMPRFMALATNEQFADAVNATLRGARAILVLSLTVMEGVINFIIDLYRSTLLCFLELVVRGGLAILIGAVQEVNELLQSVTNGLRNSIQNDIQSANNIIKGFIDGVNKVNPFSDITPPQINVPSLDGLANIQLPPSFQDSLTKLNSTLPTVADLKEKIESIINQPFELLKKDINDTFASIQFNSSIMPVPEQNRLSFCNDIDMSVVDDIGQDLIKTAKIGTIILIILALVLVGLNCLLTWYKWRCMGSHLEYTRQAWTTDPTMYHTKPATGSPQMMLTDHNLLILQANSSHPLITRITNQISQKLRLSPSQHTHMQWFFNYIFHAPAVAVFLIGFFGLLCVQLQLWAMGPLMDKYNDRAASAVADYSRTIGSSINESMYTQSAAYANAVNAQVDAVQSTINNGVFGWVNGTTVTLNTTINAFYTDIEEAVNSVFSGTILEKPAQDFIFCLIGTKVDAIENALTFLHDNLKIDMPRMNQSSLVLSQSSVDEATGPIAAAAIGGGTDDKQGLIGRLVNSYAASLRKERVMFLVFLGLWVVVVLMGLCIVFYHSYGRQHLENRRRKRWLNQRNVGIDGVIIPFRQSEDNNGLAAAAPWNMPRTTSPDLDAKIDPEKTWDSQSGENKPVQNAKRGLMASAKRLIPRKAPPPFIPDEERRQTAWFDRVATILGKKQQPEQAEGRNISNPELQHDSNDLRDAPQDHADDPKSRWSHSPVAPMGNWTGILSPNRKGSPSSSTSSIKFKSPSRAVAPTHSNISPRPLRPRNMHARDVSVPSDIRPSFENDVYGGPTSHSRTFSSQTQLQQPLVPVPLHLGFDNAGSRYPAPSTSRYQVSSRSLPIEGQRHRRSLSVPAAERNLAGVGARGVLAGGGLDRLLTTTTCARKPSMSENPFVTPFDDEHRVRIDQPPVTRKSIPLNPFEPVAT